MYLAHYTAAAARNFVKIGAIPRGLTVCAPRVRAGSVSLDGQFEAQLRSSETNIGLALACMHSHCALVVSVVFHLILAFAALPVMVTTVVGQHGHLLVPILRCERGLMFDLINPASF